jgi:hypothetical protein
MIICYVLDKKYVVQGFRLIPVGENCTALTFKKRIIFAFRNQVCLDNEFISKLCENTINK